MTSEEFMTKLKAYYVESRLLFESKKFAEYRKLNDEILQDFMSIQEFLTKQEMDDAIDFFSTVQEMNYYLDKF